MDSGKIYKYVEFGILILGVVLFVKYSGISIQSKKADAFEWEKEVNVYLANGQMGSSEDCSKVFPIKRKVPNAEILGPAALDALLNAPTDEEKSLGYSTSINEGVLLQKFEMDKGVAHVDFNRKFSEVAGSCRVSSVRSQVEQTLKNLPDVASVLISVNDQTEGILEP